MKKDMKLIMESWRSKVLNENQIQSVGQLKKLIAAHRAKEAGKEVGKKAVELAIEQVPIVNNLFSIWKGVQDANGMIKKLYGADDTFKTQTGLDLLNIDDNISKIVDDQIEAAFINDLLKTIERMDDNDPIPNVEDALKAFLKRNFDQHTVTK